LDVSLVSGCCCFFTEGSSPPNKSKESPMARCLFLSAACSAFRASSAAAATSSFLPTAGLSLLWMVSTALFVVVASVGAQDGRSGAVITEVGEELLSSSSSPKMSMEHLPPGMERTREVDRVT